MYKTHLRKNITALNKKDIVIAEVLRKKQPSFSHTLGRTGNLLDETGIVF